MTCVYCKKDIEATICIYCDGKHVARKIFRQVAVEADIHKKRYEFKTFDRTAAINRLKRVYVLGFEFEPLS